MLGRATLVGLLAVLLLAMLATAAYAKTELVSHSVTEITGAEALAGSIGDIQRVEIGSAATTVTLQNASTAEPLVVDYSSVTGAQGGSSGQGGGGALVPLLTLSVGAAALRSVLGLLRSIGRLGSPARRM